MEELLTFLTIAGLEIILGIDNLVVLTLILEKVPQKYRLYLRMIGLSLAYASRIAFLFAGVWIQKATTPIDGLYGLTGRDLLFLSGGCFLCYKALKEIFEMNETVAPTGNTTRLPFYLHYFMILMQICFIDIVFSLDSILVALALSSNLKIIISAMAISILSMVLLSGYLGTLLKSFWRFKIMALLFVVLTGLYLIGHGTGYHIDKAYIFFALFFCFCYEILCIYKERYFSDSSNQ